MQHPNPSIFDRLRQALLPAASLWLLATPSHATPVFEPVQAFALSSTNPSKLLQASDGNFYGTTYGGGSSGLGTVFRMTPGGTITTLVHFTGTNGINPATGLVQGSDGNFYGTTLGLYDYELENDGRGSIFRITPSGTLTTLVKNPGKMHLVEGSDGNFYVTVSGPGFSGPISGPIFSNAGVFKMTPSGTTSSLASFANQPALAPLVQGVDGDFYGMTSMASSSGSVFRMTPSGTVTTLVTFAGGGGFPSLLTAHAAGLVQGSDGNFYGTRSAGISAGPVNSFGSAFRMTPSGTLTTLVIFTGSNGLTPLAELVQSTDGNFYGTTSSGGSSGLGTVFQMTPSGTLTTVVNFNGINGSNPSAGLVQGSDGNLYGTTTSGGTTSEGQPAAGGQIYRLRMGPGVSSEAASNITANSATLNGTVNPGGYVTPVSFHYGTDPALATFSSASAGTLPAGTTDVAVEAAISGLAPGTTYYFRVLASNVENTVPQYGSILSFTTASINLAAGVDFPTPASVPLTVNGFTATGQTVGPLTLGFGPAPGQVLTLVNNTSANPISGNFTNLPDGGTIATSYGGREFLFVADYSGGDGNDVTLTLLNPEIAVEQPLLTDITDGGSKSFGTMVLGNSVSLVFTIKNTGPGILNGLTITKSGTDQAAFTVTASPTAPVTGPAGTTAFTLLFNPTASGAKTAAIHIASDDADESPFDIILTGQALSANDDTDTDGLNDAAEFNMAELGFNWQVDQSALVNMLLTNATGAGLFTANQIQAMNSDAPLIAKDVATGKFKLTMDWKKSTNLSDFLDFPAPAGSAVSITPQGDVEFEFSSPDNAAFFRIEVD